MLENLSMASEPVIIVADDHRATRHLIRNILERDGFQVIEAKNGREALKLFVSSRPDLVLLDIIMPVMDGLDACARLKKMPGGSHVPVLMFTGHDEEALTNAARHSSAGKVVVKLAFNPDQILVRVTDDGVGFDLSAGDIAAGNLGFIKMRLPYPNSRRQ